MKDVKATIAAIVLAVTLTPTAQASHLGNYANNPVEHDDQGRSHEPDFAAAGMLGATDCPVDVNADGRCTVEDLALWPTEEFVAGGCKDDAGRQPSGLCGFWTVVCPRLAELAPSVAPGCEWNIEPPTCAAQSREVRFLDTRVTLQSDVPFAGIQYVEFNRKLHDAGVFGAERSVGLDDGSDIIIGPAGVWAWHGIFRDKNCNGVIDHVGDGQTPDPRNEFTWLGNCLAFPGLPGVEGEVCRKQPTVLVAWEWPGLHNPFDPHCAVGAGTAYCFSAPPLEQVACYSSDPVPRCVVTPGDMPGAAVICDVLAKPARPLTCGASAEDLGDPLFGLQDDTRPDFGFDDRTGDPDVATRMWVAGSFFHGSVAGAGWPTYHYDQSLLVTTLLVTRVNPGPGGPDFTDVDRFSTRAPLVEDLLQGTVKPVLRANWLVLRELL